MEQQEFSRLKTFYRLILPLFKIIGTGLQKNYQSAFPLILDKVELNNDTSVLDVGTGTGGLAGLFLNYTPNITGIDFSPDMLVAARKRFGDRIKFINKAAHEVADFADNEFDLVTAAYTLHDMNNEYRLEVLKEMRRVAGKQVIIFDFLKNKSMIIRLAEAVEGSHYVDFINSIDDQLALVFPSFEKIKVNKFMALYVCQVQ